MTEYFVFGEVLADDNGDKYTAYGIKAFENGRCIMSISDIDTDREYLEGLVRLMNEERLEVIHMRDAVEDFLGIC